MNIDAKMNVIVHDRHGSSLQRRNDAVQWN